MSEQIQRGRSQELRYKRNVAKKYAKLADIGKLEFTECLQLRFHENNHCNTPGSSLARREAVA